MFFKNRNNCTLFDVCFRVFYNNLEVNKRTYVTIQRVKE